MSPSPLIHSNVTVKLLCEGVHDLNRHLSEGKTTQDNDRRAAEISFGGCNHLSIGEPRLFLCNYIFLLNCAGWSVMNAQ